MTYLDYLTTHTYDELPVDARAEISRADYDERRRVATTMEPAAEGLPPALAAAFAAATEGAATEGAGPRVRGRVVKSGDRRPWLLAAGWLLFAVALGALLLRPATERVVYRTVAAEAPPAEIITVRDTVLMPEVRTIVRYQTVRDTVLVEVPTVEYLAVTDTLYVPMPLGRDGRLEVTGSRSLADREGVTRFLVGAE